MLKVDWSCFCVLSPFIHTMPGKRLQDRQKSSVEWIDRESRPSIALGEALRALNSCFSSVPGSCFGTEVASAGQAANLGGFEEPSRQVSQQHICRGLNDSISHRNTQKKNRETFQATAWVRGSTSTCSKSTAQASNAKTLHTRTPSGCLGARARRTGPVPCGAGHLVQKTCPAPGPVLGVCGGGVLCLFFFLRGSSLFLYNPVIPLKIRHWQALSQPLALLYNLSRSNWTFTAVAGDIKSGPQPTTVQAAQPTTVTMYSVSWLLWRPKGGSHPPSHTEKQPLG